MDLFAQIRIHEGGAHRNIDTLNTPCIPGNDPIPSTNNSPFASPTTANSLTTPTDSTVPNIYCPHCRSTRTTRIGLVSHLRIHRMKAGGPVPGAPTGIRRIRLRCPRCRRTFMHRMGLSGHMRIHENLQ
ncbi:hypothetical protein SprV_0602176900 [Sparganum proliferum]